MLSAESLAYAKSKIGDIPDFPTPGVLIDLAFFEGRDVLEGRRAESVISY